MATIKSYTDLSQSKKLAEILPLESADMYYILMPDGVYNHFPLTGRKTELAENTDILCWSLAALISVLPLEIDTHKQTDGYKIYYYVESYMKRMGKEIYLSTERHENLVDACVDMIERLYEAKML